VGVVTAYFIGVIGLFNWLKLDEPPVKIFVKNILAKLAK